MANIDNSTNNRIVSIVDDDIDIATLYRDALKPKIENLFTFTDPILALEHFQINKWAYGLIISDLRMPGLDGMDFLNNVKQLNPNVRTILMTAFELDDKIFQDYYQKKIIDAFIQKPVRIHDLISAVDNQLQVYEEQARFVQKVKRSVKKS